MSGSSSVESRARVWFYDALQSPCSRTNDFARLIFGRCEDTLADVRCDLSSRHPTYHWTRDGLTWCFDEDMNVEIWES